ncbi:Crp/Fnr family transcriptional regulator [Glacieibacterium megasporae]|uniref:Crp/Fnr family transcriptional regulator n=1 Tax=Glacieibacterium megasporae TaxID=2835787 RepID=UPI0021058451|nr:Crp/Fnr family transcriptional regulator [Polymorphobacter megasporae]
MSNAFIDKLYAHVALSPDDISLLETECAGARDVPAGHDLIREGDPSGPLFIILEGWACRYQILSEGVRQITAFLMPGDSCDMHLAASHVMDHSIATLTDAKVASIPRARFQHLIATRPTLTQALWWSQLVDEGVLRAWIVSMGRRNSVERVAHLMCELYVRARNIGLNSGDELELPLTQLVLSDALGLTPVHVNRVLMQLRTKGIMRLRGGVLIIDHIAQLAALAGFDEQYLQRKLRETSYR